MSVGVDICPIMSIGDTEVDCTEKCAWYDTELRECAVSRINGSLKNLEEISNKINN